MLSCNNCVDDVIAYIERYKVDHVSIDISNGNLWIDYEWIEYIPEFLMSSIKDLLQYPIDNIDIAGIAELVMKFDSAMREIKENYNGNADSTVVIAFWEYFGITNKFNKSNPSKVFSNDNVIEDFSNLSVEEIVEWWNEHYQADSDEQLLDNYYDCYDVAESVKNYIDEDRLLEDLQQDYIEIEGFYFN